MSRPKQIRLTWSLQIIFVLCSVIGVWFYGIEVAPKGLALAGSVILPSADMVPVWYGSREVLFHRGDPYSAKVTASNQIAIYGREVGAGTDRQRFAYPAFTVFLFLPFAALPLTVAEKLAQACFSVLTVASIAWWAGKPTIRCWIMTALLIAATLPFFLALYSCQPTLLFAAILAASFAAARSGRLTLCGLLLATALSKPQLALPVVLAIGAWALGDIRHRKRVLLSLAGSGCILMIASYYFSSNWLPGWFEVLRDYTQYTAAAPRLISLTGVYIGTTLSVVLLCSLAYAIWKYREDLPFTVAYCIAVFSLVMPFHHYDEVLLLAPITWIALNRDQFQGWTSRLLVAAIVLSLCMGGLSAIAISLVSVVSQPAALVIWDLPFRLSGIFPVTVILALAHNLYYRNRVPYP